MTAPVRAPTPKYRSCLTSGSSGRPGDAEDAQLQGQRRVVADQRGQLDQGPFAERRHRGVVLLVVQVGALRARAGQGPHHRVGDLLLLVGEAGIRTGPISAPVSPASRPSSSCESRSYALSQACATTRIASSLIRGASSVRNLMAAPSSCSACPAGGA